MSYKYKRVYLTEKSKQVEALAPVENAKIEGLNAYNKDKSIAIVPLQGHVLINKSPKEYAKEYDYFSEKEIDKFPKRLELVPNPNLNAKYKNAIEHLKNAEEIVIATDFDNEGAAIAMNIIEKAGVADRVVFMLEMGSTHPKELRKAIDNPKDIPYKTMAEAGRVRAWIDFLEGMYLSRALSIYLGNNYAVKLNYGGVKAPLTYIVVERDLSYENHKVSYFWTVKGKAIFNNKEFEIKIKYLTEEIDKKGNTKKVWSTNFETEAEANEAIKALVDKDLKVVSFNKKNSKTNPPQLFELTGLQSEMSQKFKVLPIKSMEIAQQNYDNPVSIQVYPRTEIPYLKSSEYEDVPIILKRLAEHDIVDKSIIDSILSKKIPKRISVFNDKEVVAHGAIIPTKEGDYKGQLSKLPNLNKNMFDLVSKRYVANFMEDYEYENITGETEILDDKYKVVFSENIPKNAGWKKIYDSKLEETINNYNQDIPGDLTRGDIIHIKSFSLSKSQTKPKPPFTMASLLIAMDKIASLFPDNEDIKKYLGDSGIGTSATRSKIIEEVMSLEKNDNEPFLIESKNKIRSTEKARNYIGSLPKELVSPIKRALLSKKIKEIEKGNLSYEELVNEYLKETKNNIELIKKIVAEKGFIKGAEKRKVEQEELGICPKCKKGSIIEKKKIYSCTEAIYEKVGEKIVNKGCSYMIFKNALEKYGKNNFTKTEVKKLLKDGRVQVSLKSKKSGASYSQFVIPDLKWGIKVDFKF